MFEGIIPPIITPFHDDMSVDEKGYADVIEYMIANGVHAIIVGGTTGENYALSSCLLYTSPSPRDQRGSRMASSA